MNSTIEKMRQIKLWLVTIAMLLCSGMVNAYDFEADGIFYVINQDASTPSVSITHNGASGNTYSGDIVIPSTVNYENTLYQVTKIGNRAFSGDDIQSISLPSTITVIEDNAFRSCPLKSVFIPENVTKISLNAFSDCTELREVFFTGVRLQYNR